MKRLFTRIWQTLIAAVVGSGVQVFKTSPKVEELTVIQNVDQEPVIVEDTKWHEVSREDFGATLAAFRSQDHDTMQKALRRIGK